MLNYNPNSGKKQNRKNTEPLYKYTLLLELNLFTGRVLFSLSPDLLLLMTAHHNIRGLSDHSEGINIPFPSSASHNPNVH